MRRALLMLPLLLATGPAHAVDPAATSVTCAGAVTTRLGPEQELRDLQPTVLPVLGYRESPGDRQFKHLVSIGGVPVRLYIYRVNETILHMQVYEQAEADKLVLADTPLAGELSELTWRSLGGSEMVTVYCY